MSKKLLEKLLSEGRRLIASPGVTEGKIEDLLKKSIVLRHDGELTAGEHVTFHKTLKAEWIAHVEGIWKAKDAAFQQLLEKGKATVQRTPTPATVAELQRQAVDEISRGRLSVADYETYMETLMSLIGLSYVEAPEKKRRRKKR